MGLSSLLLAAALSTPGYPVCFVIEDPPGVFPEVTCYDTRLLDGWRACSDKEAVPPGSLFVNFDNPFRAEGYTVGCGPVSCPGLFSVSGRFDYKDVARNEQGVAVATGFIKRAWEPWADDFEPMDRFATSSCTFSRIINSQQ